MEIGFYTGDNRSNEWNPDSIQEIIEAMKRNLNLEEFTDGRIYDYNDMVKADTHDCAGCHLCCTGMGNSVVLDPFDAFRLQQGLGKTLETLEKEGKLELAMVDGCILPYVNMTAGEEEACVFLNSEGRCSIHPYRPGVCRLFPLGRLHQNGDFKFVLQTGECVKQNRLKIKVSKWIDSPSDRRYHNFVCRWHQLLKDVEDEVRKDAEGERARMLNMVVLQYFYFGVYEGDFYDAFARKEERFRDLILCKEKEAK